MKVIQCQHYGELFVLIFVHFSPSIQLVYSNYYYSGYRQVNRKFWERIEQMMRDDKERDEWRKRVWIYLCCSWREKFVISSRIWILSLSWFEFPFGFYRNTKKNKKWSRNVHYHVSLSLSYTFLELIFVPKLLSNINDEVVQLSVTP